MYIYKYKQTHWYQSTFFYPVTQSTKTDKNKTNRKMHLHGETMKTVIKQPLAHSSLNYPNHKP